MTPPHAQHRPGFHLLLTPLQLRRSLPVPSPEAMPGPDWTWCLGLWPGSSKNPQYLIFRPPPRMSSEEFCPKHLCTKNSLPPRAYTSGTPCSNTHIELTSSPLLPLNPKPRGVLTQRVPLSPGPPKQLGGCTAGWELVLSLLAFPMPSPGILVYTEDLAKGSTF